jgi:hypothetical protein
VQVTFKVKCDTQMGESVAVVGSHSSLGSWDISQAQPLQWSPIHYWQGSISFTGQEAPQAVEFKALFLSNDRSVRWEQGANHQLLLEGATELSAMWNFK